MDQNSNKREAIGEKRKRGRGIEKPTKKHIVGTKTGSKRKTQGQTANCFTIPQLLTQPQDASANDPIIISDNDKEDSIVRLSRSWDSSSQKKIVENHAGKPPCKECGITKEQILCFLELSQPHLPPDLPFSEKSMDSLELKTYLCAIHNHVVNPFNTSTTTKFSTLKEDLDKKTEYQACKECGIHQAYISVLLNWSRSYLTNDDSLFGRMIYGTNDKRNHGKDTEDKERHQFMLRMYFGAITAHVENPFSIDDQSSKDDASEDDIK
jgi:ribosomal protein S14